MPVPLPVQLLPAPAASTEDCLTLHEGKQRTCGAPSAAASADACASCSSTSVSQPWQLLPMVLDSTSFLATLLAHSATPLPLQQHVQLPVPAAPKPSLRCLGSCCPTLPRQHTEAASRHTTHLQCLDRGRAPSCPGQLVLGLCLPILGSCFLRAAAHPLVQ